LAIAKRSNARRRPTRGQVGRFLALPLNHSRHHGGRWADHHDITLTGFAEGRLMQVGFGARNLERVGFRRLVAVTDAERAD
jgi:hypothetical protein